MNIKQIEKSLNKENKLYFLGYKNPKGTKLEEFIIKFITDLAKHYHTHFKTSNVKQTHRGRLRSLGDIYLICKFYYPTCRLKTVIKILYDSNLLSKNNIQTHVCSILYKRVWGTSGGYIYRTFAVSFVKPDEYGNVRPDYLLELNK